MELGCVWFEEPVLKPWQPTSKARHAITRSVAPALRGCEKMLRVAVRGAVDLGTGTQKAARVGCSGGRLIPNSFLCVEGIAVDAYGTGYMRQKVRAQRVGRSLNRA
jgi:hypothetical protein